MDATDVQYAAQHAHVEGSKGTLDITFPFAPILDAKLALRIGDLAHHPRHERVKEPP
jgi:hypothetical protein